MSLVSLQYSSSGLEFSLSRPCRASWRSRSLSKRAVLSTGSEMIDIMIPEVYGWFQYIKGILALHL